MFYSSSIGTSYILHSYTGTIERSLLDRLKSGNIELLFYLINKAIFDISITINQDNVCYEGNWIEDCKQ